MSSGVIETADLSAEELQLYLAKEKQVPTMMAVEFFGNLVGFGGLSALLCGDYVAAAVMFFGYGAWLAIWIVLAVASLGLGLCLMPGVVLVAQVVTVMCAYSIAKHHNRVLLNEIRVRRQLRGSRGTDDVIL